MEQDRKNKKDSYQFMDETIKNIPPSPKKIARRAAVLAGSAVAFGLIAAVCFAWLEPKCEQIFYPGSAAQVSIPEDEDPSSSAETFSSSAEESVSDAASTESVSGENAETEPAVIQELTLDDYQKLHNQLAEVAENMEPAMVQVIGITNQMDYFNRTYENEQEISGLIVADTGSELFILTEYRVVDQVERIQVTFSDGTMADATFQKADPNTELAILKVDEQLLSSDTMSNIQVAVLGSSYGISQGTVVLAVGSPNGYTQAISSGVITAASNTVSLYDTYYPLLNTDILGSSDGSGVLINLQGQVLGIIQQQFSPNSQDTVTAIAISKLKSLIEDLSNNIDQPFLGIKGQNVTSEISGQTGIPMGVLVTDLYEQSPAMLAGIKEADVIVKIGDDKISTLDDYRRYLAGYKPGDTIIITAMRKGAEGYTEVTFKDVSLGIMTVSTES